MTSHYTILEVSWDDLWTLLLGYNDFMVTALGSCLKWLLVLSTFIERYQSWLRHTPSVSK